MSAAVDQGPPIEWDDGDDFWSLCKLTTTLTDPPRHELSLPSGHVLRLKTADFFDSKRFTLAFVDVVGSFPPLPEKKAGKFLLEQFRRWLDKRVAIPMPEEESGDRGALWGDIRRAISSCPETDDPRDLDRGALYRREDGAIWINARILLERVRRVCPVKFAPADFYVALGGVGMTNLDVQRDRGWRGRVWSVPISLIPEPTLLPAKHPDTERPSGVTAHPHGAFDDLLEP
jgi:hypothetical protein